jgi:HPt (histidine-containing phosphotransfer) domain-containing protein
MQPPGIQLDGGASIPVIEGEKLTRIRRHAPPAGHPACFEPADLIASLMGNEDLARRVARVFVETMPAELVKLANAIGNSDAPATRLSAHSIKGAAATAGGRTVADLASRLEQLGHAATLASAPEVIAELGAAFESLLSELRRFSDGA